MAFGSGTTQVARADVEFHAETGKFEADVKQAAGIYNRAIDQMSDEALRMSVAQEKLDRAIHRFGPTSIQARSAAVNLRKEMAQLRHEEDRVAHSAAKTHRQLVTTGRGAIAASGAFKGLGNALFFASGAFAGSFGIIYALRSTIAAASEAQVANAKLAQSVRNAGLAWLGHRKQILDTIEAQAKLTSFDDEELKDSFSRAIIRTKDLTEAFRLNAIAADYARASGKPLEQAMTLVLRASLGQTASLKRLGIEADKVTTAQDRLKASGAKVTFQQRQEAKAADALATKRNIIAALEAKLSGQSEKFARTAAGRQARFNKVLEDTQEILGVGLLPTVNRLLTQFSEWLDEANKTGDTQRELNRLLGEAGRAAHAFTGFLEGVRAVVTPLSNELGGMHNTVKLLIEAWAVYKLVKIATAVKSIGTAWGFVGAQATKAAAETVVAEQAIGAGAVRATGKVGLLGRALGGLGGAITIGITGGLILNEIGDARNAKSHAASMAKLRDAAKKGFITREQIEALPSFAASDKEKAELIGLLPAGYDEGQIAGRRPGARTPPAATGGGGGGGGTGAAPRTAADIELDISRAQGRNDENAEIKFHRELAALYQRQINNLERRKNLTLLQKQRLTALYGQLESEQSAVESIVSGQQSEARARTAARAAASRKAHDAHKEKVDTEIARAENKLIKAAESKWLGDDAIAARKLIALYRKAAHDAELTAKERAAYDKKRLTVRGRLRAARAVANEERQEVKEQKLINAVAAAELKDGIKDDEKALKALIAYYRARAHNDDLSDKARQEAERKRLAAQKKLKKLKDTDTKKGGVQSGADFLASLQGVLNTYGGNLFAPGELRVGGRGGGAMTAHTIAQTSLLRDQTRILYDLGQRVRTPASSQGYTNMTSLFDGYATA